MVKYHLHDDRGFTGMRISQLLTSREPVPLEYCWEYTRSPQALLTDTEDMRLDRVRRFQEPGVSTAILSPAGASAEPYSWRKCSAGLSDCRSTLWGASPMLLWLQGCSSGTGLSSLGGTAWAPGHPGNQAGSGRSAGETPAGSGRSCPSGKTCYQHGFASWHLGLFCAPDQLFTW